MKHWTNHPVLKIPSKTQAEKLLRQKPSAKNREKFANRLEEFHYLREEQILLEKTNAYHHGSELEQWKLADEWMNDPDCTILFLFGGNRAGKSEWCAKRVSQFLVGNEGARAFCCHTTSSSSIEQQQPLIWKYTPEEYKAKKKTRVTNLSYTQKNGFSKGSFILPNRSQCWFKNYEQSMKVLEGSELDLVWCDELVPQAWVETLAFRLVTRNGKMIVSFTPVEGYSAALKEALAGLSVTKWADAELLPKSRPHVKGGPPGKMPVMGVGYGGKRHVWFFTEHNPFGGYSRLKREIKGKTEEDIKLRAYGWVSNPVTSKFPRFSENHILPADQIPKQGTNYMATDPTGGDRNWFSLWARVDDLGRVFVYREWPDFDSYGEWALPDDKADGKVGPAQHTETGRSISQYRAIFRELEKEEGPPYERFIDPRGSRHAAISMAEGSTCLLDQLAEEAENVEGPGRAGMVFTPAAGLHIEEGVQVINDKLFYDINKPVSHLNEPKLYISDKCQNLIYALKEWTGKDGEKGACKDPVDTLRYLLIMQPGYIKHEQVVSSFQGGGY